MRAVRVPAERSLEFLGRAAVENEGKLPVLRQRGVHGSWTNGHEL